MTDVARLALITIPYPGSLLLLFVRLSNTTIPHSRRLKHNSASPAQVTSRRSGFSSCFASVHALFLAKGAGTPTRQAAASGRVSRYPTAAAATHSAHNSPVWLHWRWSTPRCIISSRGFGAGMAPREVGTFVYMMMMLDLPASLPSSLRRTTPRRSHPVHIYACRRSWF